SPRNGTCQCCTMCPFHDVDQEDCGLPLRGAEEGKRPKNQKAFDFIGVTALYLYNLLILHNVEIVTFRTDCTSTPISPAPAPGRPWTVRVSNDVCSSVSLGWGRTRASSVSVPRCLRMPTMSCYTSGVT